MVMDYEFILPSEDADFWLRIQLHAQVYSPIRSDDSIS